jgi:Zn-dependent protease
MDLTTRGSFRLFRVAGITVYLHWSWFLVAVLQISSRPDDYLAPAWKVVEYISLFALVLMHEFGHALACRSVGGRAREIVLWPLGGIAYVSPPPRAGAVLWSIAAGPLVNLVLILPTAFLWQYGASQGWAQLLPDPYRYVRMLCIANIVLFVFNMLPIYPLDGGQILHALLWFALGRWRSLQYVSLTGMVFGAGLFLLTLMLGALYGGGMGGVMMGILAVFIVFRSLVGFQQAKAVLFLLDLPRHEECACPHCGMNPPRGTFWVCSEHCQTRFDLFETRGRCSGCGAWYLRPECPHCQRINHIDRWFSPSQEGTEEGPLSSPVVHAPTTDAPDSRPV